MSWSSDPTGVLSGGSDGAAPVPAKSGRARRWVVTGDGAFSILDRGRGVILNFDVTGSLKSEARIQGWTMQGNRTYAWNGSRIVYMADLATPDRAGFPLHVVNVETGEIESSLGSIAAEPSRVLGHYPVAVRQDRQLWVGMGFGAYEISLWEMNRPLRTLRREAGWFPTWGQAELAHDRSLHARGERLMPRPALWALALSQSDSLLWVLGSVADADWSEADPYDSAIIDDLYDSVIEILDVHANRVIASQRFDPDYSPVQGAEGRFGNLVITANGSLRYRIFRARLDAQTRSGDG